ncbi:hypothetical protein M422DRAFT_52274 [Sphaerobolus stellatus SS14]|uniref:Uncharacterized protein n=1 Tax=Sphaerobolus stellatus (strain SS14) TaxID=990650 RepID=A0A0C9V8H2_SPHS4|nr:hypothetical protein M422DRAFT_52274 [Sphaerobolus stellatus SS14]
MYLQGRKINTRSSFPSFGLPIIIVAIVTAIGLAFVIILKGVRVARREKEVKMITRRNNSLIAMTVPSWGERNSSVPFRGSGDEGYDESTEEENCDTRGRPPIVDLAMPPPAYKP